MHNQCLEYSLAVFGFIINFLQVVHICMNKRKTLFQIFLMSLSMADLLTCIFSFLSTWFYHHTTAGHHFESSSQSVVLRKYIEYGYAVCIFLSAAHICLIAGDRFLTVSRPLKHKLLYKHRLRVCHIIIWIVVPLLVSFLVYCESLIFENNAGLHLLNLCFVIFFIITSLICVFVYASITCTLKQQQSTRNCWRDNRRMHRIKRIYILCFMTTVVFIGCTIPPCIGRLTGCKDIRQFNPFLTLNAGLNSFIYFFYAKLTNACNCCSFDNSKSSDKSNDIDAIKIEK